MKNNEIKALVIVREESNPELYAVLKAVPPRSRAERLRILATVSIARTSGVNQIQMSPPAPTTRNEIPSGVAVKTAKKLSEQF